MLQRFIIPFIFSLLFGNCAGPAGLDPAVKNDLDRLRENADLAASYLTNNANEQGRYVYRRYEGSQTHSSGDAYNILRHAGTMYALGQYATFTGDDSCGPHLSVTARYLQSCCIAPLRNRDQDTLAVWSLAEVNGGVRHPRAKLGGTALGILGLQAADQYGDEPIDAKLLNRMGNALLAFQEPSGRFRSVFLRRGGLFDPNFESLFYPGETILSLLKLYRSDGDQRWLEAAVRGLRYICVSRSTLPVKKYPSDHWVLLATAELLASVPPEHYAAHRPLFLEHAANVCRSMMLRQRTGPEAGIYAGSYNKTGNTTPVSTKMEGMIAIGPFLDDYDPALSRAVRASCRAGLAYLDDALVRTGDNRGGVTYLPAGVRAIMVQDQAKYGRIQIDNVQHVLSGWLWALENQEWLFAQEGSPAE